MARLPTLAVWLDGHHVANLEEPRSHQLRLTYTDESVERFGIGAVVLSASLPVRRDPYSVGATRPVLEGLLPEGEARTRLERRFGIPRGDSFALLAALGRDCAGAMVLMPSGARPVSETGHVQPLSVVQVANALADLPEHPLGVAEDVRLSLAGLMNKLLLVRLADGSWGRPTGGAPSTHILKPEPARFPGLVALEAFGLQLATAAGLVAAEAEVVPRTAGRPPTLVVARYDREAAGASAVRRLHQEDFCQATGTLEKYEHDGGPSFRAVASVLRTVSTAVREDLSTLVKVMTFTVAIGNADAHGRNLSLLYDRGARRLAPLYDVIPTTAVRPRAGEPPLSPILGMRVNGVDDVRTVTGPDLLAEAASWRVPAKLLRTLVHQTLASVADNAEVVGPELDVARSARRLVVARCVELLASL